MEEFRQPEELVSLYAEPQQERELAILLREAVLSGRSLIADCSRTHRGIRITFGLISARQVKKIRKILTEETQSAPAAGMTFYPLQNSPENRPEKP